MLSITELSFIINNFKIISEKKETSICKMNRENSVSRKIHIFPF